MEVNPFISWKYFHRLEAFHLLAFGYNWDGWLYTIETNNKLSFHWAGNEARLSLAKILKGI